MSNIANRDFSRILLIKPSSLGDVIHALPVLHGLRQRYSNAHIDWLVATPFAALLQGHPELNGLILFDRKRYGQLGRSIGATADFARFVQHLRARRYDLVIDLQGLFRTGFLSRATGAPVRIGPGDAREGARWFYTHRTEVLSIAHAVDRNYAVAKLLGFENVPITLRLPLRHEKATKPRSHEATKGAEIGQERPPCRLSLPCENAMEPRSHETTEGAEIGGQSLPSPLVVVAPGARWETKRWPVERFAEVIDALETAGLSRCVLVGSAAERPLAERILAACRAKPSDLVGRTSLVELAAIIEKADLVLCHDSAAAHLAVALNRPLVCLIGPTNPARTGPYQRMGDVIRVRLDCSPCYFRRLSQCPHDHRCMQELDVPTVLSAIKTRLSGPSGRTDRSAVDPVCGAGLSADR